MKPRSYVRLLAFIAAAVCLSTAARALERPGVEFKIFQFPADKIPRIDGDPSDWDIVPESYVIGLDQLADSPGGKRPDPKSINVKVRVGWVKGLDRLYVLYEAW